MEIVPDEELNTNVVVSITLFCNSILPISLTKIWYSRNYKEENITIFAITHKKSQLFIDQIGTLKWNRWTKPRLRYIV